jgi:hypothetical protein
MAAIATRHAAPTIRIPPMMAQGLGEWVADVSRRDADP